MVKLAVSDSRTRSSLFGYIAEVWGYRRFINHMAAAQLRSRLRRSMLGVVWIVLEPVILAAIYVTVFGKLFQVDDIIQYAIYVLIGHVFFTLLSQTISVSTGAFLDGKLYMQQSRIPSAVFPLRTMIYLFVCFLYAFAGIMLIGFSTGRMLFSVQLLWVLPLICLYLFFLTPLSILSAIANIKFGDFKQIATYILTLSYYLSPVFIPRSVFEQELLRPLEFASPIIAVLDIFRNIFMYAKPPDIHDILNLVVWGVGLWIIAILWLRSEEEKIVYYG